MKATKYLKDMLALYYATNDVNILQDITDYLGINWEELAALSEIMQQNQDLFNCAHDAEKESRAFRKVYK